MTFFKDWFVEAETNDLLVESALNYIEKKYIFNESAKILTDLFKLIENEEDEDVENLSTNDWDRPGAEDAKPIEDFSDEEDEEEWDDNWWKDSRILIPGYTSPRLSEIISDSRFTKRLNELYSDLKNYYSFQRSKEIEGFKKIIIDHEEYVQFLVNKQKNGEKILVRNIAELNDKKQKILSNLKKLGYCLSEQLDQEKSKYEFSDKTRKCIQKCLEEKNDFSGSFDEKEISNKKDEFISAFRQICIYGFPKTSLELFANRSQKTTFEDIEDIEILRFLEMGEEVRMIEMSADSIAVDNPEDVEKVIDRLTSK